MKFFRLGLLAALLAALLGACSQAAQPPQPGGDAASPAPSPAGTVSSTGAVYPGPEAGAAYPGPTAAAVDDGPLVIPEPSSSEVGVISGVLLRVNDDGTREPISRGALYLGGLVPDAGGTDSMVGVDKSTDPVAALNSRGEFVFVDVPVGRYGLMYDNLEGMLLLNNPETSDDFIIEVAGGQKQDLGELAYPLPAQE